MSTRGGTSAIPVYRCSSCRDSGLVFKRNGGLLDGMFYDTFVTCPDCDGRSRLCGEVDEPEPSPMCCLCRRERDGVPLVTGKDGISWHESCARD
jgi:hypothetical protein